MLKAQKHSLNDKIHLWTYVGDDKVWFRWMEVSSLYDAALNESYQTKKWHQLEGAVTEHVDNEDIFIDDTVIKDVFVTAVHPQREAYTYWITNEVIPSSLKAIVKPTTLQQQINNNLNTVRDVIVVIYVVVVVIPIVVFDWMWGSITGNKLLTIRRQM